LEKLALQTVDLETLRRVENVRTTGLTEPLNTRVICGMPSSVSPPDTDRDYAISQAVSVALGPPWYGVKWIDWGLNLCVLD